MKKMLAVFSGLITTTLISQTTFAYTANDKEKNLSIITASDFNENEIKELIVTYFNNVENIKQIKHLDIKEVKEKTLMILTWLFIACLIDEKEEIKTVLTTKAENINMLDLDFYKLFSHFMLKLSNEKLLKLVVFAFFSWYGVGVRKCFWTNLSKTRK